MQAHNQSFQCRGGLVELVHVGKHLAKSPSKKLHNYTTFWIENLTQRWMLSWLFSKSEYFFKKKGQWKPCPSSLATHLLVWMNMHQYPWICLNILENACIRLTIAELWICLVIGYVQQTFEYVPGSKCVRNLNMVQLYMQSSEHSCNCYDLYVTKSKHWDMLHS